MTQTLIEMIQLNRPKVEQLFEWCLVCYSCLTLSCWEPAKLVLSWTGWWHHGVSSSWSRRSELVEMSFVRRRCSVDMLFVITQKKLGLNYWQVFNVFLVPLVPSVITFGGISQYMTSLLPLKYWWLNILFSWYFDHWIWIHIENFSLFDLQRI